MDIKIVFTEDPTLVLDTAREFLASRPVLHNLILSIFCMPASHEPSLVDTGWRWMVGTKPWA